MNIHIVRLQSTGIQTLGQAYVYDGLKEIFKFNTLELPWKGNQKNISCIPKGKYKIAKYFSSKFGKVFLFETVRNRSFIEIHAGNFYSDIQGCILPGKGFTDINQDGYLDVYSSKNTMNHLLDITPDKFTLTISSI